MRKKILWITETAVMLALLIVLQGTTKPLGQIMTGSCVNAVLAITTLLAGVGSGLTIALVSPIFAFLFGIAPNAITVPVIMVGNTAFVVLLKCVYGPQLWKKAAAWIAAAVGKFAVLYALVVWVVCGIAADALFQQGVLKKPMLQMLPATFSWPQLVTALIGGAVAMLIVPVLKKALHRD